MKIPGIAVARGWANSFEVKGKSSISDEGQLPPLDGRRRSGGESRGSWVDMGMVLA